MASGSFVPTTTTRLGQRFICFIPLSCFFPVCNGNCSSGALVIREVAIVYPIVCVLWWWRGTCALWRLFRVVNVSGSGIHLKEEIDSIKTVRRFGVSLECHCKN